MQNKIRNFLDKIAQDNKVSILFACESGSRARGFPSKNSDYDIRIIYKHDLNWYLNLHEQPEVIAQLEEDLDLSGWELRRTLMLLSKSNTTIFEWIQSPIIYKQVPNFLEGLHKLAYYFFSPSAAVNYYQEIANKFLTRIGEAESITLKDYFYTLRLVLAANWIIYYQEIPPMQLDNLLSLLPQKLTQNINELKQLKAEKEEEFTCNPEQDLTDLLFTIYEDNKKLSLDLPTGKGDLDRLSSFFLSIIKDEDK